MRQFPAPIQKAAAALGKLPGVGPKTALRYAFSLLRLPSTELEILSHAIAGLRNITICERCKMYADQTTCELCRQTNRDDSTLCVVAESRDIATIEASLAFKGRYFVLGGSLSPIDGRTPDTLNVAALMRRIEADKEALKEIILAFSPDVYGESTIMYLARLIKPFNLKITRLARGLPIGADLEYADEVTLSSAIIGRNTA